MQNHFVLASLLRTNSFRICASLVQAISNDHLRSLTRYISNTSVPFRGAAPRPTLPAVLADRVNMGDSDSMRNLKGTVALLLESRATRSCTSHKALPAPVRFTLLVQPMPVALPTGGTRPGAAWRRSG